MPNQKKIVFVHGREIGAIKTVTNFLSEGLKKIHIAHEFFNMSDYGQSMLKKIINSALLLRKESKENLYVFLHFDPMIVGVLLTILGFKNKINVVHIDMVEYHKNLSGFKKHIFLLIIKFLRKEKFVFVSKEAESKAKHYFQLKDTHAIYNIYNFISRSKNTTSPRRPIITLGSVARLHPVKNIDLLIRVFNRLIKEGHAAELLIYGTGPEEKRLKSYVSSLGLKDCIKFKGEVFDKDVIYNSIDALVSFSSYEGFGMTIVESIDYGKPVFYTDCSSGPREIMAPSTEPLQKTATFDEVATGFLVKPVFKLNPYARDLTLNESEYADYLGMFVNKLIEKGFSMEFDSSRFSEKKITEQWENIINGFGDYYLKESL